MSRVTLITSAANSSSWVIVTKIVKSFYLGLFSFFGDISYKEHTSSQRIYWNSSKIHEIDSTHQPCTRVPYLFSYLDGLKKYFHSQSRKDLLFLVE